MHLVMVESICFWLYALEKEVLWLQKVDDRSYEGDLYILDTQ